MSWLDALLGRIFSSSTELELRGGVNYTDGLTAVENVAENRIDVGISASRILGIGGVSVTASANTPLTDDVWAEYLGTFTLNADSSLWTIASSGLGLTWGGTSSAVVMASTSLDVNPPSTGNQYHHSFAIDSTPEGHDYGGQTWGGVQDERAFVHMTRVEPGEQITIMVRNTFDNDDVTLDGGTFMAMAFSTG